VNFVKIKVVEVNFVDINAGVVENKVVNFVKIKVVEINAGVVGYFVVNFLENIGIFFDNFFESCCLVNICLF